MSKVEFAKFDEDEESQVARIVACASALFARMGREGRQANSWLEWRMDIAAVHASCPLRLSEMAEAGEKQTFDFAHDVTGIYRHLDRSTGELGGCFLPRFARGGD